MLGFQPVRPLLSPPVRPCGRFPRIFPAVPLLNAFIPFFPGLVLTVQFLTVFADKGRFPFPPRRACDYFDAEFFSLTLCMRLECPSKPFDRTGNAAKLRSRESKGRLSPSGRGRPISGGDLSMRKFIAGFVEEQDCL